MKRFSIRFLGNPRVIVGIAWLALVLAVALLADVIAPADPFAIVGKPFLPPAVDSALSVLGLGAPNQMSWGFMIGAGRSFMREAWWLVTIPGVVILMTVLSINLVGEGLNDALNPRLADV
jgi:peptide/nickel transport system permease protein